MASPPEKRPPPPPPLPFIGRAGNLTIFITPPATTTFSPSPLQAVQAVQAPPIRWEGEAHPAPFTISLDALSHFLCVALAKAQHVHSSLDSYVADWFGLNHSKYQRELNDYYERINAKASEV